MKVDILGVKINNVTFKEALERVEAMLSDGKKHYVVTVNPEFIVTARNDGEFKDILNRADLALPDGFGLILASKFLRTKLRIKERVAGSDVAKKILEIAPKRGLKIGVVGARKGKREEVKELIEQLKKRYGGLKIDGLENIDNWREETYDVIFAAHGMREQERWIWENLGKVKAKVFVGIGGSLDFLTKFSQRAPLGVQKIGLEWLWRAILEPRRLPRIFTATVIFPLLVFKEAIRFIFTRSYISK